MSNKVYSDTNFTAQVKTLLSKIYGRGALHDSVLDCAIGFYEKQPLITHKQEELQKNIDHIKAQASTNKYANQLLQLEREQRNFLEELQFERHERHQKLHNICKEIIELCEGDSFAESNRKSAQLLGTIQLISPLEGTKVAVSNEQSKPLYKSVLCLRLLDKLFIDGVLVVPFVKKFLGEISVDKYKELLKRDPENHQKFVEQVKIPLVMAALLQDIGNNHPDAVAVLKGKSGDNDVYRMLNVDERKSLLQISYKETIKFLIDGLGKALYIGNSKVERDKFNQIEHEKLRFIKNLLKSAVNPKLTIGNLLKVPQIYSSIILSTKANYNYKLLPKVYSALHQNAERGVCSGLVVDALESITGHFPQGYGVTYIPHEQEINDRYEYAVVNQLYPEKPNEPLCRTSTRNLAFMGHGQDIVVTKSSNLYFVDTAKSFSSISKERLNEILELLASNYQERKELDLLPRCWQPTEFFSKKINQKLWNKATQ